MHSKMLLLCCKNEVPKKLLPCPSRPRVVTPFGSFSSLTQKYYGQLGYCKMTRTSVRWPMKSKPRSQFSLYLIIGVSGCKTRTLPDSQSIRTFSQEERSSSMHLQTFRNSCRALHSSQPSFGEIPKNSLVFWWSVSKRKKWASSNNEIR